METDSEKEILEYKKRRFLEEVEKSAHQLRAPVPTVKFWKHYEGHFPEERAHIHVEQNLICIAEPELKLMDEADIQETASHEVSHLVHQDHSDSFHGLQMDVKAGLWSPPHGTIGALPEDYVPEVENKRKQRPVKYKCNYHICGKKVKTSQCKYCEGYFCESHVKPREAGFDIIEFENDATNSHPCLGYSAHLGKESKKENELYIKKLDEVFNKSKRKTMKEYKVNLKKETKPLGKKKVKRKNKIEEEHSKENEEFLIKTNPHKNKHPIWNFLCGMGLHKWSGYEEDANATRFCRRCGKDQ